MTCGWTTMRKYSVQCCERQSCVQVLALQCVNSCVALIRWCSPLQIYREKVHDLLANAAPAGVGPAPKPLGPQPALNVRDDAKGRVIVEGLTEVISGWQGPQEQQLSTTQRRRLFHQIKALPAERAVSGPQDMSLHEMLQSVQSLLYL